MPPNAPTTPTEAQLLKHARDLCELLIECDLLHHAWPQQYPFETDFLQPQCKALLPSAFGSSGYFIDIGVPADLARAKSNYRFVQKLFP